MAQVHVGDFMGFPLVVDSRLKEGEIEFRDSKTGRLLVCWSGAYINHAEKLKAAVLAEWDNSTERT